MWEQDCSCIMLFPFHVRACPLCYHQASSNPWPEKSGPLGCWADCYSYWMDYVRCCWAACRPWNHHQKNGLGALQHTTYFLFPPYSNAEDLWFLRQLHDCWRYKGDSDGPPSSFFFSAHDIIYPVWRQMQLLYKCTYRFAFLLLRPRILNFLKYLKSVCWFRSEVCQSL